MEKVIFFDYNSVFSRRLRSLIEEKNISKQKLADEIGVSRQAISQYCDGSTVPNADKLLKIAEYFNVSLDFLVGKTEAKTNDKDVQFICDYTGLNEVSVRILNEFKRFHDFDFLNYLIKSSEISIGVDDYKATVERDSVFLKHAPIDLNKYFDIEEYIYSSENKYDKIAESLKRTLRSCLSVIDSVDLHYFRIIDSFKDCLNDFTAGKQKEIDRMRNQIRETLYKLEVKEYADNNEEE